MHESPAGQDTGQPITGTGECVHLCCWVSVCVCSTLNSHHWLSAGEQCLYERDCQQRLLRWDHLLPAALQRPCQAERDPGEHRDILPLPG